jgi:3-deoxy-manno-octulosonate cytidylyltransferase (CMP-KDO synthetase)
LAQTIIAIPARLAATRLPDKPLADIHGEPMIVHVWRRAMAARVGRVIVATDSTEIATAVRRVGGDAIMTRTDHPSGSDRIYEAILAANPEGDCDRIVNVQGDLPTIDPKLIRVCADLLDDPAVDIGTLAAVIVRDHERDNPAIVKAIGTPVAPDRLRALYFTRATAPTGPGPLLHHIGMYAYRRAALARFVTTPPTPLERRERLEQLRAIESGMRIDVQIVDTVPLGVDTPDELERARRLLDPAAAATP